ncbi:MAG: GNAT family N-acetyltransferase [Geminicoccaceae bacterium]
MIRLAKPEEAAAIQDVAERAYQIYVEDLGRPPAPMIADFAKHIDRDWVIVFELNRVVAGYAILMGDGQRALLDNIAVDPAFQGRGIGRALIDEVERHAAALGHADLTLYTNVVMTANIAWYEKLGFAETGQAEEHGFHRVYMSKTIASRDD